MKVIVKETRKEIDVEWYDELPDEEGKWFYLYQDKKTGIVYTEFELEPKEYYGGYSMKRLEELARMVLDMRAKQKEFDRLSKVCKYTKHIDAETIAELYYELKMAQKMVEDECKDILGIDEEYL